MPRIALRSILIALLVSPSAAQPQSWAWDDGTVPYVQTPVEIVERMMRMAEVRAGDFVIDLGSGDGRIVIEAAKRGARGLGVDLDPSLVKLATQNAQQTGVGERARFEVRDIFETDLSPASVVTMYLLSDFNKKLLPRLLALKPGTRIVSHDGSIGDWPADETLEMRTPEKPVGVGGISRVELWIVPAELRGTWTSQLPQHGGAWRFQIAQRYQIFKAPSMVAGATSGPGPFLLAWLLGGAISLCGALVYAELASRHPHTGGEYVFLNEGMGRGVAFLFAWSRMTVIQTGAIAAVAFVFGDYASEIFSFGAHSSAIWAAAAVLVLTALNFAGTLQSKTLQKVMETVLIAGLSAFSLAAIVIGGTPKPAADGTSGSFGFAMMLVLLAYGGWNEAAYLAGEVRNARSNMTRIL